MNFLNSKAELIVPGTVHNDIPADNSTYVAQTAERFCRWFGGATATKEYGYYLSCDGKLVNEPVTRVWSHCDTNQLETHAIELYSWAKTMCNELDQECIAVILNGQMCFITAE